MWRAYLARTMTGQVGGEIRATSGSVSIDLNGIESISLTFPRSELGGLGRDWWSPWAGCIVVSFQPDSGRETVIAAGPITEPISEDRRAETVTLAAQGIGALLDQRIILTRDYAPGEENDLRRRENRWKDVDLGTIVGRIVKSATAKTNGYLPIVVPGERKGTRERTYENWNLANNSAWKRIQEITEVINGPDVMFRPRWADDERTQIEWVLATGTENQPGLEKPRRVVWDATARISSVVSMEVHSSATSLANRVYSTGAGEGAGTLVQIAQQKNIPEHMPLLESVVTDSDTENVKVLREKAAGALTTSSMDQISLKVVSSDISPFGSWLVGDLVELVCEGWLEVPDGSHMLRIIAAKFDLASGTADIELQEDRLGEELEW